VHKLVEFRAGQIVSRPCYESSSRDAVLQEIETMVSQADLELLAISAGFVAIAIQIGRSGEQDFAFDQRSSDFGWKLAPL